LCEQPPPSSGRERFPGRLYTTLKFSVNSQEVSPSPGGFLQQFAAGCPRFHLLSTSAESPSLPWHPLHIQTFLTPRVGLFFFYLSAPKNTLFSSEFAELAQSPFYFVRRSSRQGGTSRKCVSIFPRVSFATPLF